MSSYFASPGGPKRELLALLDANNFYCSAEVVLRPSLYGKPVVVLSNNDGCVISRSQEAKALGIAMGAPWFKCRHLAESHGVVALSANFALYGDLSDRVMSLAAGLGPSQEVYSIDECFIGLDGVRGDLTARAHKVRERIHQWIGIPSCIGIAQTKTLAKFANHVAKSADRKPGSYPSTMAKVCNLAVLSEQEVQALMSATPVQDTWGVGPRIGKQLEEAGVLTMLDLARLDLGTVRRRWSVVLERTVRELQGTPCISLEDAPAAKKEIACTRSFGKPVTSFDPLAQAVTSFVSRAAEKLRGQDSLANQVMVFAHTSPFRPVERFSKSCVVPLPRPTGDTRHLVAAALAGLRSIYEPGYELSKAGVILMDLQPMSIHQGELDLGLELEDQTALMTVMDKLNARYGRGTVQVGTSSTAKTTKTWQMRQELKTPNYTTDWADIPVARA